MKRSSPLRSSKRPKGGRKLARKGRLRRFGGRAKREQETLAAFREAVLVRAGYTCERCGVKGSRRRTGRQTPSGLHVHHILPRSRGGRHVPSNGAALCWLCHRSAHEHACHDWRQWIR